MEWISHNSEAGLECYSSEAGGTDKNCTQLRLHFMPRQMRSKMIMWPLSVCILLCEWLHSNSGRIHKAKMMRTKWINLRLFLFLLFFFLFSFLWGGGGGGGCGVYLCLCICLTPSLSLSNPNARMPLTSPGRGEDTMHWYESCELWYLIWCVHTVSKL